MLNPDGVFLGNYRCNSFGYDLNRFWANPDARLHPELCATKSLFASWRRLSLPRGKSEECSVCGASGVLGEDETAHSPVDIYIDVHAHSCATNAFMYCNAAEQSVLGDPAPLQPKLAAASSAPGRDLPALNSAPAQSDASASILVQGGERFGVDRHVQSCQSFGSDGPLPAGSGTAVVTFTSSDSSMATRSGDCTNNGFFAQDEAKKFPFMLYRRTPSFSFTQTKADADPSKDGTGRRVVSNLVGPQGHCYTLETSFFASSTDVEVQAPAPQTQQQQQQQRHCAPSTEWGEHRASGGHAPVGLWSSSSSSSSERQVPSPHSSGQPPQQLGGGMYGAMSPAAIGQYTSHPGVCASFAATAPSSEHSQRPYMKPAAAGAGSGVGFFSPASSSGGSLKAPPNLRPFTPARYRELGRDVCLTFLDYYGVLPQEKI